LLFFLGKEKQKEKRRALFLLLAKQSQALWALRRKQDILN
jgi:hypothetical protein